MYPFDMPPSDEDTTDKVPWRIGVGCFLAICLVDLFLSDHLPYWPEHPLVVGAFVSVILGVLVHGWRNGPDDP
ncbi:hypothetical protein [uncultured Shimia sp.]|uniref:hypothetical protein n=1 Tax=uncultured Shimia sp. TaxID=573152 RepID=UPI00262CFD68|nr:hypothetical protein [uncultured Shimia sp.]